MLAFPGNPENWLYESRSVSDLAPHIALSPLCFSSVHLIEIETILKIELKRQIIAQKTGSKKVVRLSVN